MDVFSHDELCQLMADRRGPCLSAYLPTHRAPYAARRNGQQLQAQLDAAAAQLKPLDIAPQTAEEMLHPARALVHDEQFWSGANDGLALFCSPGFFRPFRLPVAFRPMMAVAARFRVAPLLPYVQGVDRFFLLALGRDVVRLYHANHSAICELRVGEFPLRVESDKAGRPALDYALRHPLTMQGAGSYTGETNRYDILRSLQRIDHAVRYALRDQCAPLVLASVGYLAKLYEHVNTYPYLTGGKVPGNPELWTEDELQSRAWRLVQPWFKKQQDAALSAFRRAEQSHLTTSDPREVILAADQGRVEMLLLAADAELLGSYDGVQHQIDFAPDGERGEDDLLDLAASKTLAHGGTVVPLRAEALPRSPLAAILRTPTPQ